MVELTRTVRIGLSPAWPATEAMARPRLNAFAGWPSIIGPGSWCEVEVTCVGEADVRTGYLVDIAQVDQAVRTTALPWLLEQLKAGGESLPEMGALFEGVQSRLGAAVKRVTLRATPYSSVTIERNTMPKVIVSQQFEFSASHRLHAATLSDEENRRIFGKCNNANGHGHNYRVEASVVVDADETFSHEAFERLVSERVIARFDHKHLNLDTAEFRQLNPSVENIARVCHGLLDDAVSELGATLARIRVWETEKTSATFPAA
jgi:6-pyruvoyltetrahydropterin/6-carboxytetrahydropterin synthase